MYILSWFIFSGGNKTNTLLMGFLKDAINRYDRFNDAPVDIKHKSLRVYSFSNKIAHLFT